MNARNTGKTTTPMRAAASLKVTIEWRVGRAVFVAPGPPGLSASLPVEADLTSVAPCSRGLMISLRKWTYQ